ncbi:hypothetical protein C8R44DRAFT_725072 [Mycena epipterygia]|nr:hypothetical protein C8R44DRAFT_725072 [Mycena epipterygia]
MRSPQERAEAIIEDAQKGNLVGDSWPSIDYRQVSTETCQKLSSLVGSNSQAPGHLHADPQTPRHQQIAQQIDFVLAEHEYLAKKCVFAAQTLDGQIRMDLEPIYKFLRAAHRTDTEQFDFPDTDRSVLARIASVRGALDEVEDMVMGNSDLAISEDNTEAEDPDATRVGSRTASVEV